MCRLSREVLCSPPSPTLGSSQRRLALPNLYPRDTAALHTLCSHSTVHRLPEHAATQLFQGLVVEDEKKTPSQ